MLLVMRIEFMKMQGLGNDFLVFDAAAVAANTPLDERTLRALADRHTGVGFDQALMLESPRDPASRVFYRIFNSDGSEVEQCANGARCIARRTRPCQLSSAPRRANAIAIAASTHAIASQYVVAQNSAGTKCP